YCLLDTDHKYSAFHATDTIPSIKIRRLLLNKNMDEIILAKVTDDSVYPPTEIEQALDAEFYIETLTSLYNNGEEAFSFMKKPLILQSSVSGGALDLNMTERKKITEYFDIPGKKYEFCNAYIEIMSKSEYIQTPRWLMDIRDFFQNEADLS
ncbi:TPA: hypothetical protein NDU07_005752, partial [Klebsiella variicola]|nr:hypothetical protein [Klebsiella variicola]